MKKNTGFTLIELLAVVVIVAIISAIGVYAVTSIMNKAKENALENTAYGIKRAVLNHINSGAAITYDSSNQYSLDLLPGCSGVTCHNELVDLEKDPWGKDYQAVNAIITRTNEKILIDIYLKIGNGKWYSLEAGSDELTEVIYQLNPLALSTTPETGEEINVVYTLSKMYQITTITCALYEGETAVNAIHYDCPSTFTKNGNTYSTPITIYKPGTYKVKIAYNGEDSLGNPLAEQEQLTEEFSVVSSTTITASSSLSGVNDADITVTYSVNSKMTLTSVKDTSGTIIVNNPVKNQNYTITKNYSTTGTKNESITVTDNKGFTTVKNYTITVSINPNCDRGQTLGCVKRVVIVGNGVLYGNDIVFTYKKQGGATTELSRTGSNGWNLSLTIPPGTSSNLESFDWYFDKWNDCYSELGSMTMTFYNIDNNVIGAATRNYTYSEDDEC